MSYLDERLNGTWKLVSFEAEVQDSGKRFKPWGDDPNGYFIAGTDGRAMALITARNRQLGESDAAVAALFRSMVSYSGTYRIDGDRIFTKVDASWNEAWNGTEQERIYRIADGLLELATPWAPSTSLTGAPMTRSILYWKRVPATY
jgi:hypothetical protein